MKAVVLHVDEEELARRHLTGLDRYDEMWEGVLHMAPAPAYEHQRILTAIDRFLGPLCERSGRGVLALGINVFDEAAERPDYRIPDFSFIAAARQHLVAPDGVRGGGPDAVIEIRSPEDETYEKFPFFARLGVREVIVIHRETREAEVFQLAGSQYASVPRDDQGWVRSAVLRVRFQRDVRHLLIEDLADPLVRAEI